MTVIHACVSNVVGVLLVTKITKSDEYISRIDLIVKFSGKCQKTVTALSFFSSDKYGFYAISTDAGCILGSNKVSVGFLFN